jgi:hypothetical protein
MDAWQHCSGTNGDRMPRHGRDAQDNRQAGRRPYCHGTAPAVTKYVVSAFRYLLTARLLWLCTSTSQSASSNPAIVNVSKNVYPSRSRTKLCNTQQHWIMSTANGTSTSIGLWKMRHLLDNSPNVHST